VLNDIGAGAACSRDVGHDAKAGWMWSGEAFVASQRNEGGQLVPDGSTTAASRAATLTDRHFQRLLATAAGKLPTPASPQRTAVPAPVGPLS